MSSAIATLKVPKNPAVRRVWICAQLRIRGNSLRKLAQTEGVSHQAMSAALMTPNAHLEPVVAGALDLTVQQLFPERFDRTGNRVCRTRAPQRSTQNPTGNA
ncbi:MAG: helix-turn-helix domain-containing protein [Rhodospirillaceae bacterium]|nr:helix-turn-helix domain-containing protein [Rhodospirillales bacterium]